MIAYHCHARWMSREFDGIITVKTPIFSIEDYNAVKVGIGDFLTKTMDKKIGPLAPDQIKVEQIIITSLTRMG